MDQTLGTFHKYYAFMANGKLYVTISPPYIFPSDPLAPPPPPRQGVRGEYIGGRMGILKVR